MKELWLKDLPARENQVVTGFFAATARQTRTTASGAPYLCVTLADGSGTLEARMWEPEGADLFAAGDVVKIRGMVCRYQDKLQLKLDKLRRADPEADAGEYEAGDFAPKTACDIDQLWGKLTGAVASFTDPHLQALLEGFLADPLIAAQLREAPAAKALHHAWIGGLLEHIVSLVELCDRAAPHYPEVHRDLLLAGAILHDIGKLRELRWGTSFSYSTEGQLLGHITIGIGMVEERVAAIPGFPPRLRTLLLHLILAHHGRLEYGSPKLPMTAEALLLHYLDDLEAKMQTLRSEFAKAEAPGEPTDYVRSMERALLDSRAYLAGG